MFSVPLQTPLNNHSSELDVKNRDMLVISQPPPTTSPSTIPPLMQQHIPPPSSFDPRPNANHHNQMSSSSCSRADPPLSERLSHLMQGPSSHDPRLQNSQFRNQNNEAEGHMFIANAQEPPPAQAFKQQDSSYNNANSNFQDCKSDMNIPPPSSQLPFNQPPPVFSQPPINFPPRKFVSIFENRLVFSKNVFIELFKINYLV